MSGHMRNTVRLEDALLRQCKREAARKGKTLTSSIEQGSRLALAQTPRKRARLSAGLPVCRLGGGLLPGVDLDGSSALLDRMEGRD